MKKIITQLLVSAIASASLQNAQAQTNTFPATGNVGIGTITPASKLEILPANANALTIRPYGAAANNTGQLQFRELAANGNNYVGLRAPDALAANLIFRLPTVYGTNGQILGTTGSGVLTWITPGAGGGASTSLNNLTATSINQALLPGTTNTRDLGSAARAWRNLYTTGIYPRTGGALGFGIASSATALATFANFDLTGIASKGSLQIGATGASNLVMDNNEIQARFNGSATDLYLNYLGGTTHIGSNEPFAYTEVINPIYMNKDASVSGKFGIKTTSPQYDLHIPSTDYSAAHLETPFIGGTVMEVQGTSSSGNTWGLHATAPLSGYAGWFSGNVYCTGSYLPSDERLKNDIQPLQNALDKIMKLEVKTYNFKQDYKTMHLPTGKQNGFIAQNLESVFPELIKESADKTVDKDNPLEFKAVNYIGMIPVLTAAIQEQNHNTDELKKQNAMLIAENKMLKERMDKFEQALQGCCTNYNAEEKTTAPSGNNSPAQLMQNVPNPFNKSTVINYYIPEKFTNAQLKIYSSLGVEMKAYAINQSGKGEITVEANTLTAGIYSYTLIVDDKAADVRQMIVTK